MLFILNGTIIRACLGLLQRIYKNLLHLDKLAFAILFIFKPIQGKTQAERDYRMDLKCGTEHSADEVSRDSAHHWSNKSVEK